jgi:exodeoxyribonuclease-3
MLRVMTLNANGIRAASRKGFFEWMHGQRPDVVCIQETKAQEHQLDAPEFRPDGYHCFYEDAEKKGYSGVAVYTRHKPTRVVRGWGMAEFDREGRYLEVQLDNVSIVSLYLPSGSSGDTRQEAKYRFLDGFLPHMKKFHRRKREYIVCGDLNIVHTERDIRNWKANQKNSGCLPEERAWLDQLLGPARFVDAFRELEQPDHEYTWWSNRGQAWARNVGWRIDYQIVTPGLAGRVLATDIYREQRFSDHAPLTIDYDFEP